MTRLVDRRYLWLLIDTSIAVILFVLAVSTLQGPPPTDTAGFTRPHDAWQIPLIALQTLPLAARRMRPTAVLVVVVSAFLLDRTLDYPGSAAALGPPVAFHAAGSELGRRQALKIAAPIGGFLIAYTGLGALMYDSVDASAVVVTALFTLLPFGLGREVHDRRMRLERAERRASDLEGRQAEEARNAVREERSRIARELHDVVAHEMAVMTVQASAARRVIDRDTEAARSALTAVEAAGREALDEMRRLLGVLRTNDDSDSTGPQPGLGQLDDLAAQMREAGLTVDVNIEGTARPLPPGVDLNVYRIIQESLTNALKHGGPGVNAWVRLTWGDDLSVEITDDGRGGAGAFGEPATAGHGLLGMQERIALLRGAVKAGPRPGGGFRVAARVPLDPS